MIVSPSGRKFHNVVTSFNEAGYKRYGKAFIESFLEFWPKTVRLTIFYEGDDFPYTAGLSWVPIEEVEHLTQYMENLRFPIMHGIVGNKYDINFDARMARKPFVQMHCMKAFGGKVFWLDADSITHARVPESFLDEMLPDDKFCCYLGRDGWYYTESGFIGFNGDHQLAEKFSNNYLNAFISGVHFSLPGWHDCFGFDAIRHLLGNGPEFVNLAAGLPEKTMHPFVCSRLGSYMDHKKGPRKESRSTGKDLVAPRKEPYWKDSSVEESQR